MDVVLSKIAGLILVLISGIQVIFISIASFSNEKLPFSTSLLVWIIKTPLLVVFFGSIILLIAFNKTLARMVIISSFIVATVHIITFSVFKIIPFKDTGSILYAFFGLYLALPLLLDLKINKKRI